LKYIEFPPASKMAARYSALCLHVALLALHAEAIFSTTMAGSAAGATSSADRPKCSDQSGPPLCAKVPGCLWDYRRNECVSPEMIFARPKCSDQSGPPLCAMVPGCLWNYQQNECKSSSPEPEEVTYGGDRPKCSEQIDPPWCAKVEGCTWDYHHNECVSVEETYDHGKCSDQIDPPWCAKVPGCLWNYLHNECISPETTFSTPKCSEQIDPPWCAKIAGCVWDYPRNECKPAAPTGEEGDGDEKKGFCIKLRKCFLCFKGFKLKLVCA